uniref:Uncharacterized protein n=1 Tax=Arundo donax TaxID=35708 RepID=A0A0A9A2A1_ARUDO
MWEDAPESTTQPPLASWRLFKAEMSPALSQEG